MYYEKKTTTNIADERIGANQVRLDPEELWLDQDITPEALIELDPLDISRLMVELAEHPELANPVLRKLPQ
jgi:hypothetical protein